VVVRIFVAYVERAPYVAGLLDATPLTGDDNVLELSLVDDHGERTSVSELVVFSNPVSPAPVVGFEQRTPAIEQPSHRKFDRLLGILFRGLQIWYPGSAAGARQLVA